MIKQPSKLMAAIAAVAIIATMGITAFAAKNTKGERSAPQRMADSSIERNNEKWDALTDAQKEEIYSLYDEQIDVQSQMIDKYLEFGLIDEAVASDMKANLEKQKTEVRESGAMPMGMGKGVFEKDGHSFSKREMPPAAKDTAQ